ncbi:MAG: hypothetical protein ACETWG_03785 [Candidatus Neomarinimicrobiota bacterium]
MIGLDYLKETGHGEAIKMLLPKYREGNHHQEDGSETVPHHKGVTLMRGSLWLCALALLIGGCLTSTSQSPEPLQLLDISYGGCNGELDLPKMSAQPADSVYLDEGRDTLTYEFDDALRIFLGLNYICCAPFVAESELSGDTLLLAVRDTCSQVYQTCYCRCNCYYTFTWEFAVAEEAVTNLRVELYDPRVGTVATLFQGKLDYH